jgi:hypothetical protein
VQFQRQEQWTVFLETLPMNHTTGFAWPSCRAGAVFVMPSSSCRGRHRLTVPSCCAVAVLPFRRAVLPPTPSCCAVLPSCHVLLGRRCLLCLAAAISLKEQLDASCGVVELHCLAVVLSSSRVAAVDKKVLYCLAGPPLPRSSCAAAMDESSNISHKEVVYVG